MGAMVHWKLDMSFLLSIAAKILEGMFILGGIGCVVVLALTAVEDLRTLFGLDHEPAPQSGD